MKFAINGRFLTRKMTGQERYATEIVGELDHLVPKDEVEIVVPDYATDAQIPLYENLKVVRYGRTTGHLWEQFSFAPYLIKNHRTGISLCNLAPIVKPDIVCIHDPGYKTQKQNFKTAHFIISRWWHLLIHHFCFRYAKKLITDSEFCRDEFIRLYHLNPKRITIISCGWQHMNQIPFCDEQNEDIFTKWPFLKKKEYYFSLGSVLEHKNLKWIVETAKNNPDATFAVAGSNSFLSFNTEESNVHYLGYISDSEMRTLMRDCKAFIQPSLYEGFAIPPLEALSVGSPILLAKASCMPGVYGDSARYFDPYRYDINLDELLKQPVGDPKRVLEKYTWKKSAQKLLEVMNEVETNAKEVNA